MKITKQNKIALLAAVIWALVASAFVIFSFSQGKNPYGAIALFHTGLFAFFLILSGMFMRAVYRNLSFTFKEAFAYIAIVGVVGSVLFMCISALYMKITWDTTSPIYVNNMTEMYEIVRESGDLERIGKVDEEALQQNIASLKTVTYWDIVLNDFRNKILITLILSLIIAIVMRKTVPKIEE